MPKKTEFVSIAPTRHLIAKEKKGISYEPEPEDRIELHETQWRNGEIEIRGWPVTGGGPEIVFCAPWRRLWPTGTDLYDVVEHRPTPVYNALEHDRKKYEERAWTARRLLRKLDEGRDRTLFTDCTVEPVNPPLPKLRQSMRRRR
jgi:hypothetical protein